MENASKALIMAGGLLISILVASFMILVLRKAGKINAEYDAQMSDNELARFNSQFEVYAREDNTFFDVITVANLAYDINKKNGYDPQNSVTVRIIEKNGTIEKVKYSILPKQIEKNHFFKSEGNEAIYIYNDVQSDLGGKSMIDFYTEGKEENEVFKYKYRFKCQNDVHYNETTGKLDSINFTIDKIY